MKKFLKMMLVCVLSTALIACSHTKTEEKTTFVVGMECACAPFNWQTNVKSDTTVSLGNAGYADGYDVQIAKKIADELGLELVIKKIAPNCKQKVEIR